MKTTTLAIFIAALVIAGSFVIFSTLATASEGVILGLSAVALIGRLISKITLLSTSLGQHS